MAALCCCTLCLHVQSSQQLHCLLWLCHGAVFLFSLLAGNLNFLKVIHELALRLQESAVLLVLSSHATLDKVVGFPHLPAEVILQSLSCVFPDLIPFSPDEHEVVNMSTRCGHHGQCRHLLCVPPGLGQSRFSNTGLTSDNAIRVLQKRSKCRGATPQAPRPDRRLPSSTACRLL